MKLIFTKNADNEINVQLAKGTILEDFSYTEMLKQLLDNNNFEETEYHNITDDEKSRIEVMLKKINETIEEDAVE